MDFIDLAKKRRSIRKYSPKPLEFEKVMELVRAASYGPTAGDLQQWQFILITNPQVKQKIVSSCPKQEWMQDAPVLLVITTDVGRTTDFYGAHADRWCTQSGAAAVQNILLAASDMDLGACWVGSFDAENLRDILKIPDGFRPEAIVAVGYPAETPQDKTIRALDHCTYFNAFGGKLESPHAWLRDWGEHFREKKQKAVDDFKRNRENEGKDPNPMKSFVGKVKRRFQR